MKNLYYSVKNRICWLCQWFRWGFSERQLWSLDHTITDFVLPRLKAYRNGDGNQHTDGPSGSPLLPGYKGDEMTEEEDAIMRQEWLDMLDKMILAFEYHKLDMHDVDAKNPMKSIWSAKEEYWCEYKEESEIREKAIAEGLELFAKYYQYLWD